MIEVDANSLFALTEALGIGLLIGIEREQHAYRSGQEAFVGVRSFTLASLAGAISMMTGGVLLVAVVVVLFGVVRIVEILVYNEQNVGITTSLALVVTVLLGALALQATIVAASVAVVIAALLAAREVLHNFSRSILTAVELRDGLILGVSILVILPILPDYDIGPSGVLNPRNLFIIVVIVMLIGAVGHFLTRVVGARLGLPLSGFLSGFVSSTTTIAVLAKRAIDKPNDARSAASGAVLSSVSSLIQIGIILLTLSPAMFVAGIPILLGAGLTAGLYGAAIFFLALRSETTQAVVELPSQIFSVKEAVKFALIVASVMLVSAVLSDQFGSGAILLAVALAGLASTNSAAVALASLVAVGQISAVEGILPLAVALSTNTVVRIGISLRSKEPSYRGVVAISLLLQLLVLWGVWWLDGMPISVFENLF